MSFGEYALFWTPIMASEGLERMEEGRREAPPLFIHHPSMMKDEERIEVGRREAPPPFFNHQ